MKRPVEKLETVVIDIPNKKFEINGVPFGDSHNFHMSFENGNWYLSVEIPKKYKAEHWGVYDTQGNKVLDKDTNDIK
ncbi:MAG: hypothetical protein ACK5JH_13165 [Anaerocolumna sp.]